MTWKMKRSFFFVYLRFILLFVYVLSPCIKTIAPGQWKPHGNGQLNVFQPLRKQKKFTRTKEKSNNKKHTVCSAYASTQNGEKKTFHAVSSVGPSLPLYSYSKKAFLCAKFLFTFMILQIHPLDFDRKTFALGKLYARFVLSLQHHRSASLCALEYIHPATKQWESRLNSLIIY